MTRYPMPTSVSSLDTLTENSHDSYDSEEERRLIQEEWDESVDQLRRITSLVLLPFLGKWLGRRTSLLRSSAAARALIINLNSLKFITGISFSDLGQNSG